MLAYVICTWYNHFTAAFINNQLMSSGNFSLAHQQIASPNSLSLFKNSPNNDFPNECEIMTSQLVQSKIAPLIFKIIVFLVHLMKHWLYFTTLSWKILSMIKLCVGYSASCICWYYSRSILLFVSFPHAIIASISKKILILTCT